MAKNIVLFSDGTGNSSAKDQKTNVWRLFQALDQTKVDQIAKYDDGVGTSSNKYLAAIGGAFGWGLKRNVIDLYKFVCLNYEKGDNLYGFGFSRGAFTVRVLVGLIATEGLVTFRSSEELDHNAAAAYRHYRYKRFPTRSPFVFVMRRLCNVLLAAKDRIKGYLAYSEIAKQTKAAGRIEIQIRFLGLWETVEAYGMPLKRGIDWVLWPMLFGDLILSPLVQRACHALSLDDERTAFHPLLWDEVAEANMVANHHVPAGRITQVWFAGAHSNVGGGYPEDQLSLVSLNWIMAEAIDHGLILKQETVAQLMAAQSPYARLYDSRAGFASYYSYAPRQIFIKQDGQGNPIWPIVHHSVVMRMFYGTDHYAPISLPYKFWVLAPDGNLLHMGDISLSPKWSRVKKLAAGEQPTTKTNDAIAAEKTLLIRAIQQLARPNREAIRLVWDAVFWRRCLYFLTVGLTIVLALYPWLGNFFAKAVRSLVTSIPVLGSSFETSWEFFASQLNAESRGPITSTISTFASILPTYATPWENALENHPIECSLIAAAIMASLAGGTILQKRIHDRARLAWHKTLRLDYAKWCEENQKGWRNSVLLILIIAVASLILAFTLEATLLIKVELSVVVATLVALLGLQSLGQRPVSQSQTTATQGTFALSVARFLRNNRFLQHIYTWFFQRAVPILFVLLLLVTGWGIANRFLFDIASNSGQFCKSSSAGNTSKVEKTVTSSGIFHTNDLCWASGLVLEQGRSYRITLTTPGDWVDRTTRTDVAGFHANNFKYIAATPLKRWWKENWFKPIARIGVIGNDEYVLNSTDTFEKYSAPLYDNGIKPAKSSGAHNKIKNSIAQNCTAAAITPDDCKVLISEIKAQTTGELFLYVNDAVLMLPGATDFFYRNNTGTAMVTVEPVFTSLAPKK